MKTNDTRYVFGCRRVIAHVVRRHPVFVAPDVTQQHQHEPGEVENEFLDRNRSAKGWYSAVQCGRFVRETKNALPNSRSRRKPSGVSTAMVRQNAFLGNRKSGRQPNHQPSAPIGMMNNSRLQVYPSGVGLSGRGLQNDWVNNRPQRERSWND